MKIDLDKILTNALERKEKLEELQDLLSGVREVVKNLDDALTYFEELGGLVDNLDREGIDLIGPVYHLASAAGTRARDARYDFFVGQSNAYPQLLQSLVTEVEK